MKLRHADAGPPANDERQGGDERGRRWRATCTVSSSPAP